MDPRALSEANSERGAPFIWETPFGAVCTRKVVTLLVKYMGEGYRVSNWAPQVTARFGLTRNLIANGYPG